MKPTQTQIHAVDPIEAQGHWHIAFEDHRKAAIRLRKAREEEADVILRLDQAANGVTQNRPLVEPTREAFADLGMKLAACRRRVSDELAAVRLAKKELDRTWAAYAAYAEADALGTQVKTIPSPVAPPAPENPPEAAEEAPQPDEPAPPKPAAQAPRAPRKATSRKKASRRARKE
jgi:hypothetical protein